MIPHSNWNGLESVMKVFTERSGLAIGGERERERGVRREGE